MSTRRLQGLALILSAICMIIGQFGNGSNFFHIIAVIGVILFILGIPAVYSVQSLGPIGLIGIVLVELAAIIAVGFQTGLLTIAGIGGTLFWISAVGGLIGAVVIGWLTLRKMYFQPGLDGHSWHKACLTFLAESSTWERLVGHMPSLFFSSEQRHRSDMVTSYIKCKDDQEFHLLIGKDLAKC